MPSGLLVQVIAHVLLKVNNEQELEDYMYRLQQDMGFDLDKEAREQEMKDNPSYRPGEPLVRAERRRKQMAARKLQKHHPRGAKHVILNGNVINEETGEIVVSADE